MSVSGFSSPNLALPVFVTFSLVRYPTVPSERDQVPFSLEELPFLVQDLRSLTQYSLAV